jgi:hypothetical protein
VKTFIHQLRTSLVNEDSGLSRRKWAMHIIENKIGLLDLVELLDQEKKIAMRFIWLVGDLCELDPSTVYPAVPYFYSRKNETQIPNFDRSLAKMFLLAGIPPEIEGLVIDDLFKWLLDPKINVSTKSYALSTLFELSKKYGDLKNELKSVIEDQLGKNSISFEKRAESVLEKLWLLEKSN